MEFFRQERIHVMGWSQSCDASGVIISTVYTLTMALDVLQLDGLERFWLGFGPFFVLENQTHNKQFPCLSTKYPCFCVFFLGEERQNLASRWL